MTALYRLAPAHSPDFGRETFWTTQRTDAEWLAELEAGAGDHRAFRLYATEDPLSDVGEEPVDDVLPISVGDQLREVLLVKAGECAREGCRWVQFSDHGGHWKGALIYMGEDPIPARLARAA